ncbi:hypothetical protein EUGRSUZ_F03608 [Eucalyptus grandis]|uniref:Uncharacterized protein n=2 Tax=Eucalyptus grandis TaxID=71139 RepID=A0ACC3KM92_EUCGR|nr:hypothetical protein EUGRSUZ_F03608 [Eucalyptus grandis]
MNQDINHLDNLGRGIDRYHDIILMRVISTDMYLLLRATNYKTFRYPTDCSIVKMTYSTERHYHQARSRCAKPQTFRSTPIVGELIYLNIQS